MTAGVSIAVKSETHLVRTIERLNALERLRRAM